ncbi:methyltransferase domain-containing protein [Roseibacterium sp. SDUM158016]|uniref:methyltransferase domain-containing protein n=1 Tax=Roseicyclus sediminis TaxID=2980997 RepID=UPI0021CE4CDB|nr:methyltransferase domain-containing protein [Roseibacterium sp. SDUM158016]MCU4652189.1 methyltransferase domain-containing protein [Roseibacterium sp. SDUM158016]
MTMPQPRLVDAVALSRHRARARLAAGSMAGSSGAGFLHDTALTEIKERLRDVNRTFTSPAIVTAHPSIWADAVPGARCVAPSETLDLAPGTHDLVIHAMALHWADDPVGQIVQCRRALKSDGLFLGVAFGGETLTELRSVLAEAEIAETGGLSPRVAPMAEVRQMGALLQRAGLALPVADVLRQVASYSDLFALMRDLRDMGETNALAERHRRPARRGLFTRAATLYADSFPESEGRIRATFELVFLTGWAPHDSQQKPLRPGSASARLADALNATHVHDANTESLDRADD